MSLLEEALPRYDANEVHETHVSAPPAAAWAAVREVTPPEVRLLLPPMTLRVMPGMLLRRRMPAFGMRTPVLELMERNGFVTLGERPGDELVFGVAGRFWRLAADGVRDLASARDFAAFAEPGSARAAMNFEVAPERGGARVRTETRIAGTDPDGTRAFLRYWRVIAPGSAIIRVSWLNAIRRRAERGGPGRSARGRARPRGPAPRRR